MARLWYGGDQIAVVEADGVDGTNDLAQMTGSGTATAWNAQTGGTQYTDLLDVTGAEADHSTTSDGTDGYTLGIILPFAMPDGVWDPPWVSVNGGPRFLMMPTNVGALLGPLATATASQLTAHVEAANPHATALGNLTDVDPTATTAALDGQVLTYESSTGLWLPTTVAGVGDAVRLTTAQSITSTKTFSPPDVASHAVVMQVLPGQTADLFRALGTGGVNDRRFYLNEKGEPRAIAAAANSVPWRVKGVVGQTANLEEWTDIDNNPLSWVDAAGRGRFINIGALPPFSVAGALSTGVGQATFYNDYPVALTIIAVRISVGVAPTGASLIVDVNVAGSSIFGGSKPTITAGTTTSGKLTAIATPAFAAGAALTVDVDQIGSTLPGEDLTVQILAY